MSYYSSKSARQRALDNIRTDRAAGYQISTTGSSGSPSPRTSTPSSRRSRQRAAFHRDVSRIRISGGKKSADTQGTSSGIISYSRSKTNNSPRRRYQHLSEETKLYIVRVLSRLQYSHFRMHHASLIHGFNTWKLFLLSARTHEHVTRSANGDAIVRRKMKPMRALRTRLINYSIRLRQDVLKIRIMRSWRALVDHSSEPFLRYRRACSTVKNCSVPCLVHGNAIHKGPNVFVFIVR